MQIPATYRKYLTLFWCVIVQLFCGGSQLYGQTATTPAKTALDNVAPDNAATDVEITEEAPVFLRLVRDDDDQLKSLETAITQYVLTKPDGTTVRVDLVGAVHVADRRYFDELNRRFTKYDALLYELVAPEGTRVPRGKSRGTSGVSMLQGGLVDLLDLDFQLDRIDYEKDNFVHADMSPEEFSKSMEDRGESVVQLIFKMIGESMAKQSQPLNGTSDVDLIAALFAPDRALRLKRILAVHFQDMESMMTVFEGPNGSTLLSGRNAKALQVMEREIRAGKSKLGIFYGVGHLSDLHERLTQDLGFEMRFQKWFVAWDLQSSRD